MDEGTEENELRILRAISSGCKELFEVDSGWELESSVKFLHCMCGKIILRAAQMQVQDIRVLEELDTHESVLLPELLGLVVTNESLALDVLPEGRGEVGSSFHDEQQVIEMLDSGTLDVHIDAADAPATAAAEQSCNAVTQ
jgi:hypothetical protein